MQHIFISYRRLDSQAIVGRIHDRLVPVFGSDSIFMDIDTISIGADFREVINRSISSCHVMLLIIGRTWLNCEVNSKPRLFDYDDFVRSEIEEALIRQMPIWPVLVDGASMPQSEELPESIRAIVRLNALNIDSGRDFEMHISLLIRELKGLLTNVVEAFINSAQEESDNSASNRTTANRLLELFEALTDCHTAYLKYAADLEDLPAFERREFLRKRPIYLQSVHRLITIIWKHRAALQIYAPDVYEALLYYSQTELGYVGPGLEDYQITTILDRLAPILGGKDGFRFEDARDALAVFIRNNTSLHELI